MKSEVRIRSQKSEVRIRNQNQNQKSETKNHLKERGREFDNNIPCWNKTNLFEEQPVQQ